MAKGIIEQAVQLKKIVMMMRLLYITQVIVVIGIIVFNGIKYLIDGEMPTSQSILVLLIIMAIMLLFNGYFIFRDTNVFKRLNLQIDMKDEAYKNIEALNLELRAQRHDFLNHIQILYSLMELEAYEETSNYLNELYGDVARVNVNIKTSSVPVNALLQAKANEAEARGILYRTEINSRLEGLNMPDWELCRVIGNMIDNGFRAAGEVDTDPYVSIAINETIVNYQLVISNSSRPIEAKGIEKFFKPGMTTKKDGLNHGMGLYISREIMSKYNNTIDMTYEEGEVVVTVIIVKDKTSSL